MDRSRADQKRFAPAGELRDVGRRAREGVERLGGHWLSVYASGRVSNQLGFFLLDMRYVTHYGDM